MFGNEVIKHAGDSNDKSEQRNIKSVIHHNISNTAIIRWNEDIRKLDKMFEASCIDPCNLIKFASQFSKFCYWRGYHCSCGRIMVGALDKGLAMANGFVNQRLIVQEEEEKPGKSFYPTMMHSNVKIMSDMRKKVTIRERRCV
jgi:hypothetical protein